MDLGDGNGPDGWLRRSVLRAGVTLAAAAGAGPIVTAQTQGRGDRLAGAAPLPDGVRRASATVEGLELHYLEAGRGAPVLLLHGWPVTAYAWRKVMPAMASRYRLIAPDMPGFGASDAPKSSDKREVARLMRQLMRRLGAERVFVAGHDMGGPVGYAYAAQWPAEVRRLAFIDTLIAGFGLEDMKAVGAWHMGLAMTPAPLPETLVARRERAFLDFFYDRGMPSKGALTAADRAEYVRAYALPGRFGPTFDYYRAFPHDAEHNRVFAQTKLAMPVLAVAAGRGVRTGADRFTGVAPDVREVVLEEAGHHVPDDAPEALARVLAGFFGEDGPR